MGNKRISKGKDSKSTKCCSSNSSSNMSKIAATTNARTKTSVQKEYQLAMASEEKAATAG